MSIQQCETECVYVCFYYMEWEMDSTGDQLRNQLTPHEVYLMLLVL